MNYFYSLDGILELGYIIATVLLILGLRWLSRLKTAQRGMAFAAIGLLVIIVCALLSHRIINYTFIAAGLLIGGVIGMIMSLGVSDDAMPHVMLLQAFNALALLLIGISEYYRHMIAMHESYGVLKYGVFVLFGGLAATSSFTAYAKLQSLIRSTPIIYGGQKIIPAALFSAVVAIYIYLVFDQTQAVLFYVMGGLSLLLGMMLALQSDAADAPLLASIINLWVGIVMAAEGLLLHLQRVNDLFNDLFISGHDILFTVVGLLNSVSSFMLLIFMCRAENRSVKSAIFSVLLGRKP